MAEYQIIYWNDIPTQVIVKKSRREQEKHELTERFIQAVDMAAMRSDTHEEDAYLTAWRKSDPQPIMEETSDNLKEIAQKIAQKIEAEYDKERLKALIKNGGMENGGTENGGMAA